MIYDCLVGMFLGYMPFLSCFDTGCEEDYSTSKGYVDKTILFLDHSCQAVISRFKQSAHVEQK